ncbi:MAG: hypothetical protein WC917_02805 [Bacilli bacterium]|jgi:hypothetical protein
MENIHSNSYPIQDGTPYFMGDEALIKFSTGEEGFGPGTYWLANKKDHTIRPFESHMALDAAFGDDLKEALSRVVTIHQPIIDKDGEITEGVLADFSLLGPEYAIKDNGTTKPIHFSTHQLKSRFGKPIDEKAESMATEALDKFLSLLKVNEDKTGIPPKFIDNLKEDSKLMAFYISSMAYGKYTLKDIYLDIGHCFKESKE